MSVSAPSSSLQQSAVDFSDKSPENLTALSPAALDVLHSVFGYQSFRKGQQEIIYAALSGQDCLVIMATGTGKSLCYQIPALCFDGMTLVVSPLISLMKDQVDQLRTNGIEADYLNSTQTFEEQQQVQNRAISVNCKVLPYSPII